MTAGRVAVNGEIVIELGSKVDPAADVVTVDGRVVELADSPAYILLNKPAGFLTTMNDPQGRPTVAELMPGDIPGLFPVGRLDMDTTGALLLTTDGALAHRVMHPSFHVDKTYEARIEGVPSEGDLDRLRTGITIDDGVCKPAVVSLVEFGAGSASVRITISEGRKRQVKRMFLAIGHPVEKLHRAAFGPIVLGDLREGDTRPLSTSEVAALMHAAGGTDKEA